MVTSATEKSTRYNFSAGPAVLPAEVLAEASRGVAGLEELGGLSIIEISHRSKEFVAIMDEAMDRVRRLFQLDDDQKVMFLQGGASTQFYMIPFNLLPPGKKAAYVDTGSWAKKSWKEAVHFGEAECVASSSDRNYSYIPKDYAVPADAEYLHITTNNTIFGTQYHHKPEVNVPLVADMSSDIFCRPTRGSDYDLIYAGAQKNIGPAGTTLVVAREGMLGKTGRELPTMIDYRTHIDKGSMFNTPPVFAVYVCNLTLGWIEKNGGLEGMEAHNRNKAGKLYGEIDRNPMFAGTAATEDRSLMNATFVLSDAAAGREQEFLDLATGAGISGIKGHRSVGGFRASIYNSLREEAVDVLIDVMQEFEQRT